MTGIDERLQGPPTIKTLEQKIDEFAQTFVGLDSYRKTAMQQLKEIIQLASDLKVDNTKLREMIRYSFRLRGLSESWLRKLLRRLREAHGQRQGQQQQQHEEERFTAHGVLQIKPNDFLVKVTVNVKTKTIERMVIILPEPQTARRN